MKSYMTTITKYLTENTTQKISVNDFLKEMELENKEAILELFNYIINTSNAYEQNSNMASLILRATALIKQLLLETEFTEEELDNFKRKATKTKHRLELLKEMESTKSRRSHINKSVSTIEKYKFRLDRSHEASFEIIKQYIKNGVSIDYIIELTEKYPHCFEEVVNGQTIYDYLLDEFLKRIPVEKNSYEPYYLLRLIKTFRPKALILGENHIKRIHKLAYRKLSKTDDVLLKELEAIINDSKYTLSEEEILNKYGKKLYKEVTEGDFTSLHIMEGKNNPKRMIITLDPSLCSLKDDAISIASDGNNYILGIHITNVNGRVPEDGLVDRIAKQNFKTYYEGPVKSIDMIDSKYNYALFSLDEGKTKQALSLYVTLTNTGLITNYYFDFDEIHIDRSLTYEQADKLLTTNDDLETQQVLRDLFDVCSMLQAGNSGQSQSYREIKGLLRNSHYEDYGSNTQTIIAEAMVLYNHLMAETFFQDKEVPFIYRIHTAPTIDHVNKVLNGLTLEELKNIKHDAEALKILRDFYPKAQYSSENLGHYGLGISSYTHATSPGRRYPDLITQRLYYELFFSTRTIEKIEKYSKLVEEYVKLFNFESKIQSDYHRDIVTFVKK